jgi:hypothetical protein
MQALNDLRQAARDRRDKLIAKVRAEYEDTIARIASIEHDLLGRRDLKPPKSIQASVERVIPSDRPFDIPELLISLDALDSRREWSRRSVEHCIARLCGKGLLHRVSKQRRGGKHHGSQPARYVRPGIATELPPLAGMELKDVLYEVLKDRDPLTTIELAVMVVELGYQTAMKARQFRAYVKRALREDERFSRDGERWARR